MMTAPQATNVAASRWTQARPARCGVPAEAS